MCAGISLSWRDIPAVLIEEHGLKNRIIVRQEGADWEIRFLFRDPAPVLPVWDGCQLVIYPWGYSGRRSGLPQTGWVSVEELEAGQWANLNPKSVDIPATFGYEKGVWFQIKEGIRGMLLRDHNDEPHVYIMTQPASHYYQIMTRSERMPVFKGEGI